MPDTRARILIVEDAEDLLNVWLALFRTVDAYNIKAVRQGSTALEIVEPDILVTDYFLGDCTGLELKQRLQKIVPSTQIIVTTGSQDNAPLNKAAIEW